MKARTAAFSLLRRAALEGFHPTPKQAKAFKPLHLRNTSIHLKPRLLQFSTSPYLQEAKPHSPAGTNPPKSAFQIPKPTSKAKEEVPQPRPEYEMTFTCKPCSTRSTHRISKQGYHHGSVLITCPDCKNRHVISDHLKIFSDTTVTIEELMRERGQLVKRGTLSDDGDLEFWEDGTTMDRKKD